MSDCVLCSGFMTGAGQGLGAGHMIADVDLRPLVHRLHRNSRGSASFPWFHRDFCDWETSFARFSSLWTEMKSNVFSHFVVCMNEIRQCLCLENSRK